MRDPASTGADYIRLLLETLGDRDPLAVQESTLTVLPAAVRGLDDARLRAPEQPGKWSIVEVVQHLADSELVCGYRMRMILSHPAPPIAGFDQDWWARELRYRDRALADGLEEFAVQRRANLRLLHSLSHQQWERTGHHSERGPESIRQMSRLYAGHDLLHLRQIERIKGGWS